MLGTVALFAAVIGVIVGWALKELSTSLRGRAAAAREKQLGERDRVLDYLHSGDTVIAAANGLAQAYISEATGHRVDRSQVLDIAEQFNEAHTQLARLRLEIYLLGPEWAVDPTFQGLNGAVQLQRAMMALRKKPGPNGQADYFAAAEAFRKQRTDLMKTARAKLGNTPETGAVPEPDSATPKVEGPDDD